MNTKQPLPLYFHFDPGHGWLEIKRYLLPDSVLKTISRYSYQSPNGGTTIFAEEDCDAPKILEYFKSQNVPVEIREMDFDCDHYCRKYKPFQF
jgi:hypothetical protein